MQQQTVRSAWTLGLALLLGLALMLMLTTWTSAQDGAAPSSELAVGATITVDTTLDELDGNGDCSLREALQAANTDTAVGACTAGNGWDTIVLSAETYRLTRGGGGEDDNVTGDLDVLGPVNIVGASAELTTINGNAIDRVFHVDPAGQGAILDLRRVMVTHGVADEGAGVRASNGLTIIRDSIIQENWAGNSGAGVHLDMGTLRLYNTTVQTNTMGPAGKGAGLYVDSGALFVQGCTIRDNTADAGGGVYANLGSVIVQATKVLSNTATGSTDEGGGLYSLAGNLVIEEGSEIAYNRAGNEGGGIFANTGAILEIADSWLHHNWSGDYGGAARMEHATATVLRSTVEHNDSVNDGGALYATSDLVVVDSIFAHNSSAEGGAIHQEEDNLVISNTTFFSNTATERGGAVYIYAYGGVHVQNSLFVENTAVGDGGAIFVYDEAGLIVRDSAFRDNRGDDGGAIEVYEESGAYIDRTTFTGNVAATYGGALSIDGGSTAEIRNCTFGDNEADYGGAVYLESYVVGIESSTIANNVAQTEGGGIYTERQFAFQNSILAGNKAAGLLLTDSADCAGTDTTFGSLLSGGNNVLGEDTGCGPTRYDWTIPPAQVFTTLLQGLADNGGALLPDGSHPATYALRAGGLAIDAANDAFCPDVDERGMNRPRGNACDVGAYESGASATVTALSDHIITVTTNEDQMNGDSECSLREALSAANTDAEVGACAAGDGWDTIVLGAGPYTLSIAGTGDDSNATGDLDVLEHVTLRGNGSTVIDANRIDRVLNLFDANLLLKGVTVTDGHTTQKGGCIESDEGMLLLLDSVASYCESDSSAGGIYGDHALMRLVGSSVERNHSNSGGGGVYNHYGMLSIQDSSIVSNTAASTGGGIRNYVATTRVSASSISGNRVITSTSSGGGGIYFDYGTLLIEDGSEIDHNRSSAEGGGIYAEDLALRIQDSAVSYNHADDQGGGIHSIDGMWLRDTLLEYNTADEEGGGIYGGGYLEDSAIRHNESLINGGGLHAWAVLESSEVAYNEAPSGGGIFASGVILYRSSVHDNDALGGDGGGLETGSGETEGGILAADSTIRDNTVPAGQVGAGIKAKLEPVTVRRSTVSGNTGADEGGGIYVLESTVHLLNSTVSGNEAASGAALFVKDGSLSVNHSTIVDNSATASPGGILNGRTTILENSIVSGNSAGTPADADCESTLPLTFGGYSIFGAGTGCSAAGRMDQTVAPASVWSSVLGPLAKNGGPATGDGQETSTHALLPSSPALDAADDSQCPGLDQRGVSRPQGPGCDVGAYEGARQVLTVTIAGSGSGTVSSAPAGIDCSSGSCQATYDFGTEVTLSAEAGASSSFEGWSGDCTHATGDCVVTMDTARSVTASFVNLGVYLPIVTKNGP